MSTLACDISEFNPPVDQSYPHRWLILRCCDGGYVDKHLTHNLAWAVAGKANGRLDGYSVYVVFEPGENDTILSNLNQASVPTDCVVMVDVESWGGKIRGDHSAEINQLVAALTQRQGGVRDRVWCYGNKGDLASIYPTRPDWLGVVVASYGVPTVSLDGPGRLVGHQYTDGTYTVPGLPNSSPPFGRCDHNQLYLAAATPATATTPEEFTVDQQAQAEFDKLTAQVGQLYTLLSAALSPVGPDGKPHQVSVDTIVARRVNPALSAAVASQRLITELGKRVAALQAATDSQARLIGALQAQVTDLANGKVNVSGQIPATLTIGSQS